MARGDDRVIVTASGSGITPASVSAMVDAVDCLVADEGEPIIAADWAGLSAVRGLPHSARARCGWGFAFTASSADANEFTPGRKRVPLL